MKQYGLLFAVLIVLFALSACAESSSSEKSAAVRALETYLQALVDKNEDGLVNQVCADKEMDALLELDAFQGVDTRLEGLSCAETGASDGATLVKCEGKIVASYSNETQEFDLGRRTYRLVAQDSNWLVCGYETGS